MAKCMGGGDSETGFLHDDSNPAQSADCAGIFGQETNGCYPPHSVILPQVNFGFKTKVITLEKGMTLSR
jgi:hypothetical protein